MGLFGKSNKCPFKNQCPTEEICSHVADSSYQDCNLYEDWSGGGVNENNSCPYKKECSIYPFNCLWGDDPEGCFHYSRFARMHGDFSSSDEDTVAIDDDDEDTDDIDDDTEDIDDDEASTTSFNHISVGKSYQESESEKTARIAAERKQAQLNRELDIAKKQAELERIERCKKEEAEKYEAKQKHREQLKKSKNYLIASLLAIFLGWSGAHKFYTGKYISGVIYLVLFWAWIPGLLGIIQGLRWLSKGQEKFIDELMEEWDR